MDCHPVLKEILTLPFDAILTTNYIYEIETLLSGKELPGKNERRRKAFDDFELLQLRNGRI